MKMTGGSFSTDWRFALNRGNEPPITCELEKCQTADFFSSKIAMMKKKQRVSLPAMMG